MALKQENGGRSWIEWPAGVRRREAALLAEARERNAALLEELRVQQYWFFRQWQALRQRAAELDITIIGDLPIFVALDSADTWADQELFDLDDQGQPNSVAGVPPDYFSATGPRRGHPLDPWHLQAPRGFDRWLHRVRSSLRLYDL